jgi:PAS domain S-box-containing protein
MRTLLERAWANGLKNPTALLEAAGCLIITVICWLMEWLHPPFDLQQVSIETLSIGVVGTFVILRTIQSDERIRRSEKLYRNLFNTIPLGIYQSTEEGQILEGNPAMVSMLGYPDKDTFLAENTKSHYVNPADRLQWQEILKTQNTAKGIETQLRKHTGEPIWVRLNIHQAQDESGRRYYEGALEDITERKHMEGRLEEERNLLQTIIDTIPDPIFTKDLQGRFLLCNRRIITLSQGGSQEAMLGKSDFDFLPRELAQRYFDREQRIFQTGEAMINEEETGFDEAGRELRVLSTKAPLYDRNNQLVGLVGIARNVTDLKLVEQKVEAERYLLRTIIDAIPDCIYVKDTQSRFVLCNQYAAKLAKADNPYAMIGTSDRDYIRTELAEQYFSDEQEILRTGKSIINKEEIGRDTKDDVVWILTTKVPLRDKTGAIVGLVGIGRDITQRKKMEQSLRESEERFRLLSESAFEGVVVHREGHIIHANDAYYRILGYTPQELEGINAIEKTVAPEDMEIVLDHVRSGREDPYEVHVVRGDGSVIPIEIHGRTAWYNNQRVRISALRDITWRKQAEKELNQYRQHVERIEQIQELGMLSATMAHELYQPLTVIRLLQQDSIEELECNGQPDLLRDNLRDSLEEIDAAIGIANRYKNIMHLPDKGNVQDISLAKVASRTLMVLGPSARQNKVNLTIQNLESLPSIEGKIGDLEEIFFILMQNSIQAADGHQWRQLDIEGTAEGERVVLTFRDTCGGIHPDHLPRIFEPFFTTKPLEKGTGLGLCIVKRILTGYGGKIEMQNHWPDGITFRIELPVRN